MNERKPYAFIFSNKIIFEKTYEVKRLKKTYKNGREIYETLRYNEIEKASNPDLPDYDVIDTADRELIFAIDPGNKESAYCIIDKETQFPLEFLKTNNDEICNMIYLYMCLGFKIDKLVVEMVASYGMAVGKSVFDTCLAIGQFMSEYSCNVLITRPDVKKTLCNGNIAKVNDSVIRQRLIDLYGEVGTKDNRGWFYGFSADIWSAYAVGIAYMLGAEKYEI